MSIAQISGHAEFQIYGGASRQVGRSGDDYAPAVTNTSTMNEVRSKAQQEAERQACTAEGLRTITRSSGERVPVRLMTRSAIADAKKRNANKSTTAST